MRRLINSLKKADIGLSCILACAYFLALPLTITIDSSGNSFLKLLTIPIAGYFAVSWFFYREKFELNIIHLFSFLYLITVVNSAYRKLHFLRMVGLAFLLPYVFYDAYFVHFRKEY